MKTASSAAQAILAGSDPFWIADLFDWTLLDGTTLHVCTWPSALVVGGTTYQPANLTLSSKGQNSAHGSGSGGMTQKQGLEVSQLSLDWGFDDTPIFGSLPLGAAARAGLLARAQVVRSRVVMATPGDVSAGAILVFSGRVAECDFDRFGVSFIIQSDLALLNVQGPQNLYQATCIWTLYGAGCGLTAATWQVSGTVSAGATKSVIPCSLGQANGYFNRGRVTFTSGQNTGLVRSVQLYTVGSLAIYPELPYVPAATDAFNALPGCDKTRGAAGCTFFSNLARFRGYPFVPVPESAI